jgi:crotonobetainyl-CoA:carnitine CoA-transferase CaiB-like acyl-CoA transferase
MGALEGLLVLDLGRILAAPWAGQMLADLGATVIKVEEPHKGAGERAFGVMVPGRDKASGFHCAVNRNKRSIAVDLSLEDGQEVVRQLALRADVLIENFIPGVMQKFGLGYGALQKDNPRLVYCSVTGFGQQGPYSRRPGYDAVFQAQSGMMAITGLPDGVAGAGPMKTGPSLVDVCAGYNAVIGILAALRHRDVHSGMGQHIDIALLDTALAMQTHVIADYLITREQPRRRGNSGNGGHPARVFDCADGEIYVSVGRDEHFHAFCRAIERSDLIHDTRFATNSLRFAARAELDAIIEPVLRMKPVREIEERLTAARVPCSKVNVYADILADPHVLQRDVEITLPPLANGQPSGRAIANPVRLSQTPPSYERPAPDVGEHTSEVLIDVLGLEPTEVDRLFASGAVQGLRK